MKTSKGLDLFILFYIVKFVGPQTIDLHECHVVGANKTCTITCKTDDLSGSIKFYKNSTPTLSCFRQRSFAKCKTYRKNHHVIQNETTKETKLTIEGVDVNDDNGRWHCTHNNNVGKTQTMNIYEFEYAKCECESQMPPQWRNSNTSVYDRFVRLTTETCIYPDYKLKVICTQEDEEIKCSVGNAKRVISPNCFGRRLQAFQNEIMVNVSDFSLDVSVNIEVLAFKRTIYTFSKRIMGTYSYTTSASSSIAAERSDEVKIDYATSTSTTQTSSSLPAERAGEKEKEYGSLEDGKMNLDVKNFNSGEMVGSRISTLLLAGTIDYIIREI